MSSVMTSSHNVDKAGPNRIIYLSASSLFSLLVVSAFLWLHIADFYHTHFFYHGIAVSLYELARLILLLALVWLCYAVGASTIAALFGRRTLWALATSDRYLLGLLVGTGIWHWGMFGLGLGGFYLWPVAFGFAAMGMVFSIPHLASCLREAMQRSSDARPSSIDIFLRRILFITLIAFVLVRGLYPLGGHDYYDHYFPYLIKVIHNGSLTPNAVWQHFYDSKGLSLFFLAML